jgi:hypothetical protein
MEPKTESGATNHECVSTEAALRKRLAEVLDFYDLARRRIAALEAEVAHLRQRESFAANNVALDRIASL